MKAIHKYRNGRKYRGKTISREEQQRRILQSMRSQGIPLVPREALIGNTEIVDNVKPHAPAFADVETITL